MTVAYIGLGSNLGDRLANLRRAVVALDSGDISVRKMSSVYETDPVGPPQPDFLNAVCEVDTPLSAPELLKRLKSIEVDLGREARERWGPREIDLDLLLYGNEVINDPELKVPHQELTRRSFVLVPLLEVAPDLRLPGIGLASSLQGAGSPGVRVYASPEDIHE